MVITLQYRNTHVHTLGWQRMIRTTTAHHIDQQWSLDTKKGHLRRLILLELVNAKATGGRQPAVTSRRPSELANNRTSSRPLAALLLCVTPTMPVNVKGGKRKREKATKNIERRLSKGHELEPETATAFRALSARGNYLAADRPDIGDSAKTNRR